MRNADALETKVYDVPEDIDQEIARLKLAALGTAHRRADPRAGEVPGELEHGHVSDDAAPGGPGTRGRRRPDQEEL